MKAVIFDMDGVITDTAKFHFEAWKELANSIGIEFDEAFNETLKGISRMESLERILALGGENKKFSLAEKEQLAATKNANYVAALEALTPSDILPGIHQLLETLHANNIKTAVASVSKNAPYILEKLEITDLFDAVADPDSVKAGKPAPDIFLKAAELVAVDPVDCIGIEDAIAGIESIKSAKMKSVGVGTPEVMVAAGADVALENTSLLTYDLLLTV